MSANVDERIVQMQFDNAQFESKAQNTITTLNSLNEALKLPTGNSGMEKIQDTSRKIDFSKLNQAIELVNYRFSDLGIIATNVLTRISNAAIDTGRKMIDALTIRPIKDGFSEYEEKMDSVKRILNSAKDNEGLPVTLDVVNKKLDELNRYSDKTIYSFRDMTTNIGKFTNAGVSLDDSVAAIQGIANEAALSGANAQEASRAMYNFAQALSAGYVKLIDWKSIENANMATVGFKEQLLETALAVGTVVEKDGQYITTTTDMQGKISQAFDATHGFNEALSHQWMTSEVLTKTLAKYADETTEIGKSAFQAATEVMTFSKLIDTLKEAMGSGWAQTWQLIIGDYGEAKELWTGINNVLSDMINASADSRNKLIGDWEVLGGRTALIDGLKEAWAGLVNIAREVEWAFSLVLEKIDGFDLVNVSLGIRNFGKAFRSFTGKHGADINGIAQGIASAFDLMSQTFSAIGRTVTPLLQPLGDLFGLILHNSGLAGRSFTDFVKSLRDNDSIYKGLQNVISILQKVYDFAGRAVSAVLKLFGIDTGFDSSINPIQALVNVLSGIGENPYVLKAASVIDGVRDAITNFVSNIQNSAGLQNATNVLEKIGGVLTTIGKVLGGGVLYLLDSAGQVLRDMFGSLKNASLDNLLNIFTAGSAAGVALGLRKLFKSIADPVEGFNGLFNFLKDLGGTAEKVGEALGKFADKITGPFKAMQESIKADIIMKIAKAIAILVASIFVLSTIDPARMGVALLGITALLVELGGAVTAISKLTSDADANRFKQLGTAMAAFAIAIGILSLATKALSGIEPDKLVNGVLAVGVLMALATLMTKLGGSNLNTKGLIGMSVAILILQISVKRLSELDPDKMLNGMLAVGVLMMLMTAMTKLGGNNFSAKGMIAMAASIFVLQEVVKRLSELDDKALVKGTVAVIGLMGAMLLLSKFGGKNFSGASMLLMAAAMVILQKVIKEFTTMNPEDLSSGMMSLALTVGMLVVALNAAKGTLGGAAAITVAAVALNLLVPVVKALSAIPFEKVLQGVAGLALALGVLIVAGGAAAGIVVPLMGLAAAITLIGIGVAALGAGLLMASVALTAFGVSLVASGASIIATIGVIIAGIIGLVPLIVTAIVEGILQIIRLIGESAQTIADTVIKVGLAVISVLDQLLLPLGEFIVKAIVFILELLSTYMPVIANALVVLVINLIDGVSLAIYNNTDKIIAAVRHLMGALIDFVLASLQELLRDLPGVGGKIYDELGKLRDSVHERMNEETGAQTGAAYAQGIADGASSLEGTLSGAGTSIGDTIKAGATGALNGLSPEVTELLSSGLTGGIAGAQGEAEASSEGLGNSLYDKLAGTMDPQTIASLGAYLPEGLGDGITENSYLATDATDLLTSDVEEQLLSGFQINSPSRMTWDAGMYLDQGLANGITENQGLIGTAISALTSLFDGPLSAITTTFQNAGASGGSAFSSGISSGIGNAGSSALALASSAIGSLSSKVSAFLQNGSTSALSYSKGIRSEDGESKNAGEHVATSVVTGLASTRNSFITTGMSSGGWYASGVQSKQGEAKNAGRNVGSSALNGAKSVDGWYSAGRDSGEGYLDGLMSKASSIARAAANVVRDAIDAARNAIDSHSPSRKWMALGEDSGEGYIIGARNKTPEINDTMSKMATGAMSAFYEGISRANMLANSDFLVTPTIAPVFNSELMSRDIDYLNSLFNGAGSILGTITADVDGHAEELNQLIDNTNRIITVLQKARPITIDGNTVIGWVDRELGALV